MGEVDDDIKRRLFTHLREGAEAIEAKDRQAMLEAEAALTGMLDLDARREPRFEKLARNMVKSLHMARRALG